METEPVHPLDLLNRDEWIYTLSQFNKPGDRWNTANAHPLFRSIFEKELKKEWLPTMFFANIPHLLNYLPLKNILELRLVDTGTKSAIDHCLHQGQVSVLKKYVYVSPYKRTPPPSINSWVNLAIHADDIHNCFVDFVPFFSQYGPQVIGCFSKQGFHEQRPRVHPLETLTYFRNLLTYIPNVKTLSFDIECNDPEFEASESCSADTLSSYLRDNPLPSLHSLNYLSLDIYGDPGSVFEVLVKEVLETYGPQLQELALWYPSVILPTLMPCLRKLCYYYIETIEQLESLQGSTAPLEGLNVGIVPNSPILPTRFFLALQPFQNTLRKLKLDTENWEFGQVDQLPVDFPQLKTLKLSGHFSGCTENGLGFLDSFPNLVKLKIGIVRDQVRSSKTDGSDASSEVANGESYPSWLLEEEHFYKSSIWTRLQSLNSVEIIPHGRYYSPHCVEYQRSTYKQLYAKK